MSPAVWGILSIVTGSVVYKFLPNSIDDEAMHSFAYLAYNNKIIRYLFYISAALPPFLWLLGITLGFISSWKLGALYLIFTTIVWIVLSPSIVPGPTLTAPRKMAEIKMALVGKYVFDNLIDADQKSQVISLANRRLREGTSPSENRTMDDLDLKVRHVFLALAMAELGIDHGLEGFQWTYVRNPFMVRIYDEKLWGATIGMLKKKYGINVSL